MRKRIVPTTKNEAPTSNETWLPLEQLAIVEITSEDAAHPVESALLRNKEGSWRAAVPGVQLLRLRFDTPQQIRRVRLHFTEPKIERTQEFVLRYSRTNDSFFEIVRQQWNFSPQGSTSEVEEYEVDLSDVSTIELIIIPDISGGNAYASLSELRLA